MLPTDQDKLFFLLHNEGILVERVRVMNDVGQRVTDFWIIVNHRDGFIPCQAEPHEKPAALREADIAPPGLTIFISAH